MNALSWFESRLESFSGEWKPFEALAKHTYYRIGGPARVMAVPRTLEDLHWLAEGIRQSGIPYFLLGLGSNLLVSDTGFDGLVIKLGRIDLEIKKLEGDPARIRTGTSVAVSTLLRRASQEGWGGLELLAGVPGSVGGAVVMNAGTHLGESGDRLWAVEYLRLSPVDEPWIRVERPLMKFDYRKNLFLPPDAVVLSAEWLIDLESPEKVRSKIDETLLRRKTSQPVEYPSCGSVFKNPKAHHVRAWEVIDRLGLRGHQIGKARISPKHSNFIVNLGGASAGDVRALIRLVKERALAELQIPMEEEVKFLGEFPQS